MAASVMWCSLVRIEALHLRVLYQDDWDKYPGKAECDVFDVSFCCLMY